MKRKFEGLRIDTRKIPTGEVVEDRWPEFWHIELNGNSYTMHFGYTATCGEKNTVYFSTAEDALSAYDNAISEKLRAGFTEVYDKADVPEISLEWLRNEIRIQARNAFNAVRNSHPDETICGYALYSCSEANLSGVKPFCRWRQFKLSA